MNSRLIYVRNMIEIFPKLSLHSICSKSTLNFSKQWKQICATKVAQFRSAFRSAVFSLLYSTYFNIFISWYPLYLHETLPQEVSKPNSQRFLQNLLWKMMKRLLQQIIPVSSLNIRSWERAFILSSMMYFTKMKEVFVFHSVLNKKFSWVF